MLTWRLHIQGGVFYLDSVESLDKANDSLHFHHIVNILLQGRMCKTCHSDISFYSLVQRTLESILGRDTVLEVSHSQYSYQQL